MRLHELATQILIKVDGPGQARLFAAIAPVGGGVVLKRVEPNLYELVGRSRIAFVNHSGAEPYFAQPSLQFQRGPWFTDARWIAPALFVSISIMLLTLLAWPMAVLWRLLRKRRWSQDRGHRRSYLGVRLVLLIDIAVIGVIAGLFARAFANPTILSDALDPVLLAIYAVAWLGVFGALLTLWAAILFWRKGVGSRWSRIHHALIAASSSMVAWFFVTFHIAGTTLIY